MISAPASVPVRFIKAFACYQPDHVASFPAETAARLIATGVAAPFEVAPAVRGKARNIAAKILRKS